jgi:molecular chaperone DnaJ
VRRNEACAACAGAGAAPGTRPDRCTLCDGHGEVLQSHGFFNVRATCPQCRGAGQTIRSPCRGCAGAGRVARTRELEIRVPPGVEDGMQLRLEGQGEAGPSGGEPGDLFCVLRVREHPIFAREGDDLHCHVPVSFPQAARGASIEVPALPAGTTRMKVPSGTQPGQVLRLRGQGLPNVRGYGRGDLLVHLDLEVPSRLTRRQEELLEEFARIEEKNVSPARKGFLDRLRQYLGRKDG